MWIKRWQRPDFIVGIQLRYGVELPSFFVTQEKKADRRNIPMVENVYLDLYYSGRYTVDSCSSGLPDPDSGSGR